MEAGERRGWDYGDVFISVKCRDCRPLSRFSGGAQARNAAEMTVSVSLPPKPRGGTQRSRTEQNAMER